ncbi:hypothetical protein L3Q82_001216 [Scortum barcoo]|uniref:Uncharacterized protein n=1 Tax=Scortum barcoo TaxID=214431 RepID=A0ACB8W7V8_9TELE|nr:hypothetical protein L3Q82_001216 [Scortum barcoo]
MGPLFSQNWICATPITWFASETGTSGRRLLILLPDTMNIWLCHSASPMLPAVFQALVNDVLRDMLNKFVFVYLDDILIFSRNKEEHVHHVQAVLQRLLENSLFVKAEKCEFHASSVSFLGFIVGRGSLQMDPAKVSAVASWPTPSSRKQLQRFLGFANFYRRFIRGYSTVAAPLTALTSSKVTFQWSVAANEAFNTLKTRFTSAPILIMPDPERQFVLEVDASDVGVGAVLSAAVVGRPEAASLRFLLQETLAMAERNYDIGNRELLAVKLALEEWRHWLEGSKQPFLVWTDHKNLEYIRSAKRLNSRQARWSLFLTRFNFSLSYRPGSRNIKPDALSRQFQRDEDVAPCPDTIISSSHLVAPLTWEIEEKGQGCTGGSTWAQRLSPESTLCSSFSCGLTSFSGPTVLRLTCHPGIQRTIDVVRQRFWWATMNEDTRGFVKACPVCSRHKSSHHAPAGLLQPLACAPSSLVSHLSGLRHWPATIPWPHRHPDSSSRPVQQDGPFCALAQAPLSQGDRRTDADTCLPSAWTSCGRCFRPGSPVHLYLLERVLCALMGASASLSSGFHPQSNGQTERMNQELETALLCMASQHPSSWSQQLLWVEYAHNTLILLCHWTFSFPVRLRLPTPPTPLFPDLEEGGFLPVGASFHPPLSPDMDSS